MLKQEQEMMKRQFEAKQVEEEIKKLEVENEDETWVQAPISPIPPVQI